MTDTSTVGHYRQILRMIYFFIFLTWRKKFNRARKPYELVDAEAELVAMEDQRGKKFKQVEYGMSPHIVRLTLSPSYSGMRLAVSHASSGTACVKHACV